jgi:hypothetical protein
MNFDMLTAIITRLLREKLVCTTPNVSLDKWGESDFAYHQTMSISKVWTKKGVGVETMRSRNLVPRVSEMKNYPLYRSDVRVVSGNAVV